MNRDAPIEKIIWIIEDHPLYRDALKLLLETQLSARIQAFDNVLTAVALHPAKLPDLILVDFNLQGVETGTRALRLLRDRFPTTTLISHSAVEDPVSVQSAIRTGVQAFISKAISPEHLVTQVRELIEQPPIAPYWINAQGLQSLAENPSAEFTERQQEIIQMMLGGKSNKQIALSLDIAEITVKQHLSKIFEKLGVNSRTQAIAKLHSAASAL